MGTLWGQILSRIQVMSFIMDITSFLPLIFLRILFSLEECVARACFIYVCPRFWNQKLPNNRLYLVPTDYSLIEAERKNCTLLFIF